MSAVVGVTDEAGAERSALGRRGLLAGALGGLLGLAAKAVAAPDASSAANGDPVILGAANQATVITSIVDSNATTTAEFASGDIGVNGQSNVPGGGGTGVRGIAVGSGATAVKGLLIDDSPNACAVGGATHGAFAQTAVLAESYPIGIAVRATTKNGIGVLAQAEGGYALKVEGTAVFSRSGRATVAKGNRSRTVTGVPLAASSLVLATIQNDRSGLYLRVVLDRANARFTIKLNQQATSAVQVGWLVVN